MTLPIRAFIKIMLVATALLACIPQAFAERSVHYTGIFKTMHSNHAFANTTFDALFYPAAHVLRYTTTWPTTSSPVTAVWVNSPLAKPHSGTTERSTANSLTGSVLLTTEQESTLQQNQLSLTLNTKTFPHGAAKVLLTH